MINIQTFENNHSLVLDYRPQSVISQSINYKSQFRTQQMCITTHGRVKQPVRVNKIKHINSLRPSDAYRRQYTNHHWFRQWLVAYSSPSHYLNQCRVIVNWTPRNKLQWYFHRYSNFFIQENTFENIFCEMAASLFRPKRVNSSPPSAAYMRQWIGAALEVPFD